MNRTLITLTATIAVASCLISCRKPATAAAKGDDVLFSMRLGGSESATKTVYTDSNSSDRRQAEQIYWTAEDMVRIWCAQCSEPTLEGYGKMDHCADYTVTPAEGNPTNANIELISGTVGLRWGEPAATHNFYAIYPSPRMTGKSSDSGKFGTGSSLTLTGHIPSEQEIIGNLTSTVGKNGKKLLIAAPDMSSLYMASHTSAKPSDSGDGVFLTFYPLSTAIQFTIENAMTADDAVMKVEQVTLMSDPRAESGVTAKNIAGAFDVKLSDEWKTPATVTSPSGSGIIGTYANKYPACTETPGASGQSKSVSIDFSGTAAYTTGLAKGERLQFTLFLLPTQSFNDLSFAITREVDGVSGTIKNRLEMEDESKISFPVYKKTYVTGLLVPDGAQWIIQYSLDVNDWVVSPEDPGYERIEMETKAL